MARSELVFQHMPVRLWMIALCFVVMAALFASAPISDGYPRWPVTAVSLSFLFAGMLLLALSPASTLRIDVGAGRANLRIIWLWRVKRREIALADIKDAKAGHDFISTHMFQRPRLVMVDGSTIPLIVGWMPSDNRLSLLATALARAKARLSETTETR